MCRRPLIPRRRELRDRHAPVDLLGRILQSEESSVHVLERHEPVPFRFRRNLVENHDRFLEISVRGEKRSEAFRRGLRREAADEELPLRDVGVGG